MSLKDMSHINHLPELIALGVDSVKIEGRMKRPEYVAAAVTACRLMRDEGEVPPDLMEKLTAVFSRSGFTDGYFSAERGRGMFGKRTKDDVVSASSALFNSLHPLYKNEYQRIPLTMKLTARDANTHALLEVSDGDGNYIAAEGECPQAAIKAPFSEEYGTRIFGKTGGTPYYLDEFTAEVGEKLTFASSQLSAMKRDALDKLSECRRTPRKISFDRGCDVSPRRKFGGDLPNLRVVFHSAQQIPSSMSGVQMAYIPLETEPALMKYAAATLLKCGVIPAVEAPRGLFGDEQNIEEMALYAKSLGIEHVMIHNAGLIPVMRKLGLAIHGGFGLNVFNSRALDAFADLGLADNELSYELTLSQIADLSSSQPRGMIIRGRIPMMLTRNCPAALAPKGCTVAAKDGESCCGIVDRTGRELPVMCRRSCSEIFNPVMMSVVENVSGKSAEALALDWVTLSFTDEDDELCGKIISEYTSGNVTREGGITAGLYFKGVF
jgi:putative protease